MTPRHETMIAEAFPQIADAARAARPLHVALPLSLSADLRLAAAARNMTAGAFAAQLLAGLCARPDLIGTVLHAVAGPVGQGRRTDGMTALSSAVLYLAASHAGPDGWAKLAPKAVLSLAGIGSHSGVISAMRRCEGFGLLELKRDHAGITAMRLTEAGAAKAGALTGVIHDGGKA